VHINGSAHLTRLRGAPSADGLENARVLAEQLRGGGFDVVLFGKLAVDDYGQQTGPMVAELLELPCATAVSKLEISDGRASIEREIEGGVEQSNCSLPAVFTCDKGLNNPRLPSLKGIMAAKKKPLDVLPAAPAAGAMTIVALALPPERAAGRIVGEGAGAVPVLMQLLTTEAKAI
jgi:electron transfer flavoprotein beta subunit